MTDSNQSPSPSSPDFEGTDPDLPERKKGRSGAGINSVQVAASAAAAVTSALAASFFGVAGTLIGAAVGSIVSTIAGAFYVDYLHRARDRIKVTTGVVIQRIPSEALAATGRRHRIDPSDLPGSASLSPIGAERGQESLAVPVEDAADLLRHSPGMLLSGRSGAGRSAANGAGSSGPSGANQPFAESDVSSGAPAGQWKKPVLAMIGISAGGFLIALGAVLVTETAIGHPISGGDSGTTISRIGTTGSTSKTEVSSTETATPTATSKSPAATASPADPGPSTTATSATVPDPTTAASTADSADSADPVDPAVTATDSSAQVPEATTAP